MLKWTIEIEVHPMWVADGFEPDDEWVGEMMMRELPSATGHEVGGRVLRRPPQTAIDDAIEAWEHGQ